jgi:hypothetical protein
MAVIGTYIAGYVWLFQFAPLAALTLLAAQALILTVIIGGGMRLSEPSTTGIDPVARDLSDLASGDVVDISTSSTASLAASRITAAVDAGAGSTDSGTQMNAASKTPSEGAAVLHLDRIRSSRRGQLVTHRR